MEDLVREKLKAEKREKEKDFKFTNKGCEKQFKFNDKLKDTLVDNLKTELKKHFKDGLPEKVEEIIKEGEKDVDEQNHRLKIADEFGFPSLRDFIKEDLARDDKEKKKLKALRKEKKEREEKSRARRGGSYRSYGGGYRSVRDAFGGVSSSSPRKRFGDKSSGRDGAKTKDKDGMKCYNCQRFGHYARDCIKAKQGGRK